MTVNCEKIGIDFFGSAPTRYQATVEIFASPEQVFAVLLDAESWVRWALPITAVEWTSGFPIDVGSTRTVDMRGGLIGYEEFIAYEHGVRMAFRFNEASKGGIRAFAEDCQIADLGGGRCRVEWTMAIETVRISPKIATKVIDPVMSVMVKRMLRKFGRLVESTSSGKGN